MGKFAELDDVKNRYEGEFPSDREAWVELRIADVEADLILMVPSVEASEDEIGPTRMARAKALVADKVLELYRNPERARTRTQAAGPYNESVTSYDTGKTSAKGYFTDEEVSTLRLRSRRSNLGVARVKAFIPGNNLCR
jgi:hypothetical protein